MLMEDIKHDSACVVKLLEKRLDAHNSGTFKGHITELVSSGDDRIALDFSEVEFIDSSGLGAIVASLKTMGSTGALVIFGLQAPTHSMFKLTRMDKVFDIFQHEDEALTQICA